jgi:hypothetical protein
LAENSDQIELEVKDIFVVTEGSVFNNASIPIKTQLLRSLVYESDLYINGKLKIAKNASLTEKLELFIMCDF